MESVGITARAKVLYSFRHIFKDRCREADLGEELHDALTGHSGGGVGRDYGAGFSVRRLAEGMARIDFPASRASRRVSILRVLNPWFAAVLSGSATFHPADVHC